MSHQDCCAVLRPSHVIQFVELWQECAACLLITCAFPLFPAAAAQQQIRYAYIRFGVVAFALLITSAVSLGMVVSIGREVRRMQWIIAVCSCLQLLFRSFFALFASE